MGRFAFRVFVAIALAIGGWVIGHAQAGNYLPQPEFEISVDAPAGSTTLTCVRGCRLAWVERGVSTEAVANAAAVFRYECQGRERCSSGRMGGYVTRSPNQVAPPDFEISVDAPVGERTVTCVTGCNLAWVERGVNPAATPGAAFKYLCKGTDRCGSGRIGGWIAR